jgi:hypothetical protein
VAARSLGAGGGLVPNKTHSMTVLKRTIDEVASRGGRIIDARTRVGRAMLAWRAELVQDLGGQDQLSTQQTAILDVAVRTRLLLDSVDSWMVRQPSLIDKRKRALHPIVQQRTALADALVRHLTALGLARVAREANSLSDYLKRSETTQREGSP